MGQTYEIDQERLYKLFKRILDDKFSELTYRNKPWWQTHEDDVEWVNSEGTPVIRYNDYSFEVLRSFYWSFMNMMPISYKITNDLFTKYFKEKFSDKPFISVLDSDLFTELNLEQTNKPNKSEKLLRYFLNTYELDGVCEYIITYDDEENYSSVIIVLDLDWLKSLPAEPEPGFVAKKYRKGLKEEIYNFTGLDVYVGSTAKRCDTNH